MLCPQLRPPENYGKQTFAWIMASVFPSIFLGLLVVQTWKPCPATRFFLAPYIVCVCSQLFLYCYEMKTYRSLPYTPANKEDV
ncbi:hypothetical protein DPMN_071217 [Dreissena polymorpha]|uniref:Uncharacterized protein n=1 Tax=Dreissena polymorpha TaxID=45954 RepID=A0A9D3Z475_DREPO|nr:hypothetical protein DPMN_071217 [Dreissena polymorpha]